MFHYYVLMALIIGLAYPLCIRKPSAPKRAVYVCIVFGFMLLMSALRYGIGNDYFNYRDYFYAIVDDDMGIRSIMDTFGFEPGFALMMKLVSLTGDYLYLNIITALLTIVPAAIIVFKRSRMPWLSAWLYLTVTFFYNSMNFTRQTIAATIILAGYKLCEEKKHIGVIILIAAASLFHTSALIMIPVYIFRLIGPSAKSFGIVGGAGFISFLLSEKIIAFVTEHLLTKYAKYADSVFLQVGLSPVYLIIPTLIAILVCSAYFLGMKKNKGADCAAVFMFCNFFIWLFIVKHFIIERFSLPVYIFILIYIPDSLCFFKEFFSEKFKKRKRYTPPRAARFAFPVLCAAVVLSTGIYNDFCAKEGVHGVFPYKWIYKPNNAITAQKLEDKPRYAYVNASLVDFLYDARLRQTTVVLCVKGGINGKLDLPVCMNLKRLGFKTDLNSLDGKSYIGVVSGGRSVLEKTGSETLTETMSFYDGKYYLSVESGGAGYGDTASLIINNIQFMPDEEGLNFAVFDDEQKKIVTAQSYTVTGYNYTYGHTYAFDSLPYLPAFENDYEPIDE